MTRTQIEKKINELAVKSLFIGNPYIDNAIKFYIGKVEHYITFDKIYSADELNSMYLDTAKKDIKKGYEERMAGYYDKWYRYNHADEGRAYDLGQKLATENIKCPGDFYIIECLH